MENNIMRLKEYAVKHEISYRTAYNHFKAGQIRGAYQLESGTIVVPDEQSKLETIVETMIRIEDKIDKHIKNTNTDAGSSKEN